MRRYRYVTPTTKGIWHDTRKAAQNAAVKAGHAYRDPQTGQYFADVFTEIEARP